MSLVSGLHHINIRTALPDETVAFFTDILGLENRPDDRPNFGFPGAWLWVGDSAVVHLVFVDEGAGDAVGAMDHVAFAAADFDGICARLDAAGIDYRVSDRPELGLKQAFVNDPNGVRVEINAS